MKFVKMSLAAAVAVAGLGTSALAIDRSTAIDFDLEYSITGDVVETNEVNVNDTFTSDDGKGTFTYGISTENGQTGSDISLDTMQYSYDYGVVKLVVGGVTDLPGNFTDSTGVGLALHSKAAGFNLGVGAIGAGQGSNDLQVAYIDGSAGPATIQADLLLGAEQSFATEIAVKAGPANVIAGYATSFGTDKSLMGAHVEAKFGGITVDVGGTLAGPGGGDVVQENPDDLEILGEHHGATDPDALGYFATISLGLPAGINVGAEYAGNDKDRSYWEVNLNRSVFKDSNTEFVFSSSDGGDVAMSVQITSAFSL